MISPLNSTVIPPEKRATSHRWDRAFPLAVLGLIVAAAAPFYVLPADLPSDGYGVPVIPGNPGGVPAGVTGVPSGLYWIVALPMAYTLIGLWSARRRTAGSPVPGVTALVWSGLGSTLALLLLRVLAPSVIHGNVLGRALEPLLVIAVSLVVWAAAARDGGLGLVSLTFSGAALTANLYNVENLLMELGLDVPDEAALTANVGLGAIVLLAAAGVMWIRDRSVRVV